MLLTLSGRNPEDTRKSAVRYLILRRVAFIEEIVIYHSGFGVLFEFGHDALHLPRQPVIVRVEELQRFLRLLARCRN